MAVMYSSNSISWVTPAFSKAICMTSCSLGGCTISLRLRLEILVASEVKDEGSHELVILLWVHTLLEVGESSGEYHRLFISIVCTCLVLAASGGIDQTQIFCMLHQSRVGCLM